jgi:threonine dehydratase
MLKYYPSLQSIKNASTELRKIFKPTPLFFSNELSNKYQSNIYLKREDLTPVRSYKIRGAYNKMSYLYDEYHMVNIVTCSAGNHAQGIAYACNNLKLNGSIFMPKITTKQKINKVKQFGGKYVKIFLEGNNFDESFEMAQQYCSENKSHFIHPFDDEKVIEGQGTVGLEILNQLPKNKKLDYLFLPIGGGGLASGVSAYFKYISPDTKIIGVEPLGAPKMYESFKNNKIITLDKINTFVDGASVKKVGNLNFPICKKNVDDVILIDEGQVCSKILEMYNDSGLIIEPAGVLSLCALENMKQEIEHKNVVAIISGSNSDVFRMPEILDRSLVYEGRKHYFKINFAQKAGSLKDFILNILGKDDDIIYFRYTKIINKELGPVIIGIETKSKDDAIILIKKMEKNNISYEKLSNI